jgi:hypothetical protein
MGGFNTFIRRSCKQAAVYWANPTDDGYGGRTFDAPVEIKCRWDDREQLLSTDEGEKIISRAVVWLSADCNVNGVMWKGTLAQLTTAQKASPVKELENICLIKRMERYPGLVDPLDIVYKAFLTPWLT